MERISCRSGVLAVMLFAAGFSTACGRSELLGGPDDELVNAGGATSAPNSSAGGHSSAAISSSLGGAGAGGGSGGVRSSLTSASKPFGGSGGFGGDGGASPFSASSSRPIAGAMGGSGGVSALAGSRMSGGAGAIGGSGGFGGTSALAGSRASGGSSATGGSTVQCRNARVCGGDVVGTWEVTSSCLSATGQLDLSMLGLSCRSVTVEESLNVTGTWMAMADGTYSDKTATKGSVQIAVPASCLSISGVTVGCSNVGIVFMALGYNNMTCRDAAGGGCTCTTTVNQVGGLGVISDSPSTRGVYNTRNNVLLIDGTTRYGYCVSGSQLTLSPQDTNPPTTGSIVFQKQ